jgi:hydroxymethylpyrimidine/phosphomethylpyrimidine kinase
MYKALTIAGSDSGGGAGIQADLKTFQELNIYGMSVITAVTAQNTMGVQGVQPISPEFVGKQIDSIAEDLGVDALKTGMLFSPEIIEVVASKIKQYGWEKVVVDPVMIAKGGASLLQQEAVSSLKKYLLPLSFVVTPNIPEAEELTDSKIITLNDKIEAAKKINHLGVKYIVIKGGHDEDSNESIDLLYDGSDYFTFNSKRFQTKNTHGTGCTFSAAITAGLAAGLSVYDSVTRAKSFITAAIEDDLHLGNGHGPTNHWAFRKKGTVSI